MTTSSTSEGITPSPVTENLPTPLQPVEKEAIVGGDGTAGNVDPATALSNMADHGDDPQRTARIDADFERRKKVQEWKDYLDPNKPMATTKPDPVDLVMSPPLGYELNPGLVAQEAAKDAEDAKNQPPEIVAGDTERFLESRTKLLATIDTVPGRWSKTAKDLQEFIERPTRDDSPERKIELARANNILAELKLRLTQENTMDDLTSDQLDVLRLARKHVPGAVDILTDNLVASQKEGGMPLGEEEARLTLDTVVSHLLCGEPDILGTTADLVLAKLSKADDKSFLIKAIEAIESRRDPLAQLHKRGDAFEFANLMYNIAKNTDWSTLEPDQAQAIISAVVKWRCESVGVPGDSDAKDEHLLVNDLERINDPDQLKMALETASTAIESAYTNDVKNGFHEHSAIQRFISNVANYAWLQRASNKDGVRGIVYGDWGFKTKLERYFRYNSQIIEPSYLAYAVFRPSVARENVKMVRAKMRELSELAPPEAWQAIISVLKQIEAIGDSRDYS